jgi:hypothetical protein
MPILRNGDRRPEGPGAADPVAVEAALCDLLQALQVDRRAVQLTPEEADALLTRLRRGGGTSGCRAPSPSKSSRGGRDLTAGAMSIYVRSADFINSPPNSLSRSRAFFIPSS